jgi:hypothetical protein
VRIRDCPAAVSGNESRHQALVRSDREATAGRRNPSGFVPASPNTCQRQAALRRGRRPGPPRVRVGRSTQPPQDPSRSVSSPFPPLAPPRSSSTRHLHHDSGAGAAEPAVGLPIGLGWGYAVGQAENREGGEKPPRPRHCDRLIGRQTGHPAPDATGPVRAGKGEWGKAGSQETCLSPGEHALAGAVTRP